MRRDPTKTIQRRELFRRAGILGAGLFTASLAACAQPAASPVPTQPAAPTKAAAQPTAAPAKPTAGAATKPAEKPAGTQAPPKPQTLQKSKIAVITAVAEYAFAKMGAEREIYKNEGIDPEFVDIVDGGTQLKALLAGEVDMALLGASAVFPAQEQSAEARFVGSCYPRLNFVLYVKPGIKDVKELEGKNMGAAGVGSFLNVIESALLRDKGVDVSKVQFANIGSSPAVFAAVEAGKVDAGASSVDFIPRAEANKNPAVIADFSKELPNYLRVATLVHERTIKDKPAYVQGMLNGVTLSNRYGLEHKDEFVKYGVEKMAKEKTAMEFLHDYDYKNRIVAADAELEPKWVEYTQQLNVDAATQKAVLPFDKVATLDFQKKLAEKYGKFNWK